MHRYPLHADALCVTVGTMKTAALPDDLSARADEVRSRVATNLSELLTVNRWSRRSAAAELGLTHRYVNDRAAGTVDLSSSDLAMFADFLEVPVSRFFARPEGDSDIPRIGAGKPSKARTTDYKDAVLRMGSSPVRSIDSAPSLREHLA